MAKQLGYSEDELTAIGGEETRARFPEPLRLALGLADRMTVDPHRVGDEEFAALRKCFSESEIVELASVIGLTNYFNRFTSVLRVDLTGSDAAYETGPSGDARAH